ncbi:hypothetical protein [Haemophilus paraphrohaemolyticus]|uniref:hypothetical protein n=1 Tax=Haemophilus paraphrohaemolyticus TaxID=736 RepID=UPI001788BCE2|nr:hypothetical protein [Haemophilus paraphrohaemolyticus]
MGIFDFFSSHPPVKDTVGMVAYGGSKKDGSHDHRTNKGADRTPAQKAGDQKRTK